MKMYLKKVMCLLLSCILLAGMLPMSVLADTGNFTISIGSSGSGKTTLLRCLNFLETPDTGDVVTWAELDGAYQEGYEEGYTEGVNTIYDQ